MAAKNKSPFVAWYAHKAFVDFGTLEVQQIGVLAQIINLIYIKNGPIDYDAKYIGKHCNIGPGKCVKIIVQLLEKEKIFLTEDGKISQEKCEKELKSAQDRRENASKNGKNGAEIRWGNEQNQQDENGEAISSAIATRPDQTRKKVKKEPPLPPATLHSDPQGTGFLKIGVQEGQRDDTATGAKLFRIQDHLTEADLEDYRTVANGWAFEYMAGKYNDRINSGASEPPKYPAKAFLGWVPKFHKNKRP